MGRCVGIVHAFKWLWPAVILQLGCSSGAQTAAPAKLESPSKPDAALTASKPSLTAAVPIAEPEPAPLPDGCYTDVAAKTEAAPLLEEVAKACFVDMQPMAPQPLLVSLQRGALKDLPFTVLDPSKCVRAVATGAKEVKELELQIVDRSDQVLGEDSLPGSIALANRDGPICFKDPGQYRAVVRLIEGSGSVAIQVWQAQ
jgi:hypothetical protein